MDRCDEQAGAISQPSPVPLCRCGPHHPAAPQLFFIIDQDASGDISKEEFTFYFDETLPKDDAVFEEKLEQFVRAAKVCRRRWHQERIDEAVAAALAATAPNSGSGGNFFADAGSELATFKAQVETEKAEEREKSDYVRALVVTFISKACSRDSRQEQMAVEIGGVLKEVLNLDADQVAKARQIHAAHGGYPASPMVDESWHFGRSTRASTACPPSGGAVRKPGHRRRGRAVPSTVSCRA